MFSKPANAVTLCTKIFSHLGPDSIPRALLLHPNYPKKKTTMRFGLKATTFGRVLEVSPVYILDDNGGLEVAAEKIWQICDAKKDPKGDDRPNGYAWQGETYKSWDHTAERYKGVATLLVEASRSGNWTELYTADGISHQVNPEFPDVVRLFNGNPWEDAFGLIRWSDFCVPTGTKPVAFRIYHLLVLDRVVNRGDDFRTSIRIAGIEDLALRPMIATAVAPPALAA